MTAGTGSRDIRTIQERLGDIDVKPYGLHPLTVERTISVRIPADLLGGIEGSFADRIANYEEGGDIQEALL